ncbi:hypothetical protein J1614_002374 [Plenodomus biglobosus]|nr:hypothetical protein J1614_002374 [Plenodomus biglobosus]
MFAALLALLPSLAVQNGGDGQLGFSAMNSCVEAVQIYFPCKSQVRATNYICLCEQYLWRVTCFEEHATSASSHSDRRTAEADATRYCRAAGSFGASIVQRKQRLNGRQIGSVISSIAGEVTSILASHGVTVPTAIITSAINGVIQDLEPSSSPKDVTATASSSEPTASNIVTSPPSPSTSATHPSTTATTEPITTSSALPQPPTTLIVGAVVGGIAALALLGILTMLILKHKKRKTASHTPTDKEASPRTCSSNSICRSTLTNESPPITDANTASFAGFTRTPGVGAGTGAVGCSAPSLVAHPQTEEKIAFHMQSQYPRANEMATTANIWELDGREMQYVQELENPNVAYVHRSSPWGARSGSEEWVGYMGNPSGDAGRQRQGGDVRSREDEDFGSPISPVSPIWPQRF